MDPAPGLAPDPAISVTDFQDANQKLLISFSAYFFLKGTFT
jgi:hypothetical protein